ncbi:Max-like protein X [Toxocara canis]|uniref:Max-like protein X n=1 Tax=Toxocara canis TaxID=6265 RepID=A0A0B2VD44_TOXCA|nr:Max-like protein X [Toxocara canis]
MRIMRRRVRGFVAPNTEYPLILKFEIWGKMKKRLANNKMDHMVTGPAVSAEPKKSPDTTDRKKATHLRCERQRREAINNGYQELKELLPSSLTSLGCKTTNAAILFRAADYLTQLKDDVDNSQENLSQLLAQRSALELIAHQYESMSAESSSSNKTSLQCHMVQTLLDACFASFCRQVDATSLQSVTRTLLPWVETLDYDKISQEMLASAYKQRR